MPTFSFEFQVNAPVKAVAAFHYGADAFKKLSPPPIFAQIHDFPPVAEGSEAEFTLWIGPLPLRWRAMHRDVTAQGFTDIQQSGPLQSWQHVHRFIAVSPTTTRVADHIRYSHKTGWRGLLSRILFNPFGLFALFTARKWLTRWHTRRATSFVVENTEW